MRCYEHRLIGLEAIVRRRSGGAVGIAANRDLPVAGGGVPNAVTTGPARSIPASPGRTGRAGILPKVRAAALIVNPRATHVSSHMVQGVVVELSDNYDVTVIETKSRGHATELVAQCAPDYEVLFALGGDGLFNEVANGAPADLPVGFLPGGASNVFTRALGLPKDPLCAAAQIAGSTRIRRISLGVANGRRFTFACGIGLDAEVVRAVDAHGRRHGRRPGDHVFALELVKLLWQRQRAGATPIEWVGQGPVALAVVANTNPYTFAGPIAVNVSPTATFEGGLDIVAPIDVGPVTIARLVWSFLLRPAESGGVRGVHHLTDQDEVRFTTSEPVPLQVDGEDLGDVAELTVRAERDAIAVIVAERSRSDGP